MVYLQNLKFEINKELMAKIKVVHIVEALGGGVYSYFIELSKHFKESETIETTIIYNDKRPEILPEKIKTDLENPGVRLLKVSMAKNISLKDDTISCIELIRKIKELKPDVIHLHSSKAGVIGRFAHFFSGSKASLFYTPHAYSFLRPDISFFHKGLYRFIEYFMAKLFNCITIACGDTEYKLSKRFGASHLIRNGIDIKSVATHYKPTINKKITMGTLGRITHNKNPELFNKIAQKYPDYNFIWIGDGELRNTITSPNIEITGWFMERTKGLEQLNRLDIYLQTSILEGLPISLIEAMALKKPIIATNVIGNKDIVSDGETGFLFDDLNGFERCLNNLTDPSARIKIGLNAHKRVNDLFNSEKNFNELEKLYFFYHANKAPQKRSSKTH